MDAFLPRDQMPALFRELGNAGYRVLAPVARAGVIQFSDADSLASLQGVHVEQAPGHYRLTRHDDVFCFSWAVGPQALKPLTFCAEEALWRVDENQGLDFSVVEPDIRPTAVIGARACDLAALALQRRHFEQPGREDEHFRRRAAALFIVAVDCHTSAETCFCHSTGDGPAVATGADLRLHELAEGYLIEALSERGQPVLQRLPVFPATAEQIECQQTQLEQAAGQQQRVLPPGDLTPGLREQWESPAWRAVAGRCLSCTNCTAVCPTCFCSSQQQQSLPEPGRHEQSRRWDSCFTAQHSYIHGIVIRADTTARYRQWLTHKLGFWHQQYGRSGCVGCGRCIAWCPAGIDLVASVRQVLESDDAEC